MATVKLEFIHKTPQKRIDWAYHPELLCSHRNLGTRVIKKIYITNIRLICTLKSMHGRVISAKSHIK